MEENKVKIPYAIEIIGYLSIVSFEFEFDKYLSIKTNTCTHTHVHKNTNNIIEWKKKFVFAVNLY